MTSLYREIPNLFAQDETDRIVSEMVSVCKADGIPETRDNCLAHFVSRVRDKLHIVLCMSPVRKKSRLVCMHSFIIIFVGRRFPANPL